MMSRLVLISLLFGIVFANCPDGLDPWYGNVCGFADGFGFTYSEALKKSTKLGADMPSIHSPNENTHLSNIVEEATNQAAFWLGLQCNGDFQFSWLDGTPVDYINFHPELDLAQCNSAYHYDSFPSPDGSQWDSIYGPDVPIPSFACTVRTIYEPLCTEDLINESTKCLQIFPAPVTASSAEMSCSFANGHLASIHSDQIGLTSTQSVWTDGTPVDYTHYTRDNSTNGVGNCTKMAVDGRWTSVDCNTRLPFTCDIPGIQVQQSGCSAKTSYFKDDHIYSPSYPFRVDTSDCEYIVKASSLNKKVALRVESFNIHKCCHQLFIYDGPESTKLLAKLSGHMTPGTIITGSGHEMGLEWKVKEAGEIEGWHFTVQEI